MGPVQFVLNRDEKEKRKMPFQEKQKIYPYENQTLNSKYLISSGFRDDVNRLISGNISESDVNYILDKYNPQNKNCKITGLKYPKETILLYATGLLIQNADLIIKNFKIFNFIQKIYQNLGFSEKEIEKCKFVEERFQKEFEIEIKLLIYDITEGIFKNLLPIFYSSFNLNFALKEICQPHIITLILNEQLLTKVELCESLSESIRYCTELKIVNFILIPKDNNNN